MATRANIKPVATAASLAQKDEAIAALAKALGHPARIGIVRLLIEKQSCIGCDIVEQIQLAQSTVSEHLRILKAAGIIVGEIERPRVCYSLNPASLQPLTALLDGMVDRIADSGPLKPSGGTKPPRRL